jgi:pimeloyl-ACP methyl ester carboxylesterase
MLVVDGHRIEVATIVRETALDPLVLLHEGLGSVGMWRDFPLALAERTGRTVIVYSRYGYGESDVLQEPREPDYMHHEARVVLPAFLETLGIERPVLFGHSDGASIALLCAAAFPDRVHALVLEAPHVFVEDLTVASIAAAKDLYATTDLGARLARYHRDADATFRGWNDIWLDPRFRSWDITGELARIGAPVLLLQGVEDEYGTPAQLDAIAERVPDVEIALLDGCRHSPHRDRPEAVLDLCARFLDRLDRHVPSRGLQSCNCPGGPNDERNRC